jgi:hypothetical protein
MRLVSVSSGIFAFSCDFHNVVGVHSFRLSPEEIIACSLTWRRPELLIPVESTAVGDNGWRA